MLGMGIVRKYVQRNELNRHGYHPKLVRKSPPDPYYKAGRRIIMVTAALHACKYCCVEGWITNGRHTAN